MYVQFKFSPHLWNYLYLLSKGNVLLTLYFPLPLDYLQLIERRPLPSPRYPTHYSSYINTPPLVCLPLSSYLFLTHWILELLTSHALPYIYPISSLTNPHTNQKSICCDLYKNYIAYHHGRACDRFQ